MTMLHLLMRIKSTPLYYRCPTITDSDLDQLINQIKNAEKNVTKVEVMNDEGSASE